MHTPLLQMELNAFTAARLRLERLGLILDQWGPYSFAFGKPPSHTSLKDIDFTLVCLVHGDEIGGLVVANQLLKQYLSQLFTFSGTMAIVVANLEAAKLSRRYIDVDLNRCFGNTSLVGHERQLAETIKPIIERSRFVLDIHQTAYSTKGDFFIFPHSNANTKWAASMCSQTPIVVHGQEFSQDGWPLDVFASLNQSVAVTYEMGEIGISPAQVTKTIVIIEKAVTAINHWNHPDFTVSDPQNLYVFSQSIYSTKHSQLVPDLVNFQPVTKGETIGFDGSTALMAEHDGFLLFPKYGHFAQGSAELCRLISKVPLNCEQLKFLEIQA